MTKLSERAMLATLHISAWGGMMHDKVITDDVNESYKAGKQAGHYKKRLVATQFLEGVSAAHSHARRIHRVMTLPWEDDGTRILTNSGYIEYQKKMKECQRKVEDEVKHFLTLIPEAIKEGKVRLGKMFDVNDYPDVASLEGKFGFDVEIKGMPEAADFRAKLSDESTKAIIKDIEKRCNDRLANAVNDVFSRIKDVVEHMAVRLREYQPSKDDQRSKGIIRDSVVQNIFNLAEILPSLNITDDPRLIILHKQLMSELVEHSPEILRADTKVRQATIKMADAILKRVEQFMK